MADRLVSVDENFNLQPAVARRQAERLGDSATPEGKAVQGAVTRQVQESTASMIGGVGIGRIIVSDDPSEPLEDGDLLIVVPSQRHFNDFSAYATGVAPSDWSNKWATGTPWTVEAAADAAGGKVLRHVSTATGRRLFAWDAMAELSAATRDAEIVFKSRSTTLDSTARAILRGAGTSAKETGYYQSYSSSSTPRLGHYLDGGAPTVDNADGAAIPFTANEWYVTRFRVEGDRRMVKMWKASTPEPAAWSITTTATQITGPGFVGLSNFGAGTTEYDWVGMAFGGATAPMAAA